MRTFTAVFALMTQAIATASVPLAAKAGSGEEILHVYKAPWCGCCTAWAEHMAGLGSEVTITELDDLAPMRREAGIPETLEGCHSATIAGYRLEGHVPPEAIATLLDERPEINGIAVPGMPAGSVGMGYDPHARYPVYSFAASGTDVFYRAGQ